MMLKTCVKYSQKKALENKATGGALVSANGDTGSTEVLLKDGKALVNFDVTYCGERTVEWQFGDTETSSIKSPPHTYTTADTFQVNVVATCITPSEECTPVVVNGSIAVDVKEACMLEEIQGECIAEYGKNLSFSTDTNYTDRTEWSVEKGGILLHLWVNRLILYLGMLIKKSHIQQNLMLYVKQI
jgi:hypothetical protein